MRVIFMGTPDFSVPALEAVHAAGHEVVLVVSRPDKPKGRGQVMQSPPVVEKARELGLPTAQPKALKSGPFPERYCGLEADVGVVIAYGRILPERLLDAPRFGCINVHASLLPRWRGAAPIQAAILAGDAETGVCTQQMQPSLDTGPVFVERRIAMAPDETGGSLHDRLSVIGAEVLVETLAGLGTLAPVEQDHDAATWAPKLEKDSGRIAWTDPAVESERRVRAMTPWPGGHVPWKKKGALKLHAVRVVDGAGAPGTVLSVDPLVVATADGALELVEVQAPGKRRVPGTDFARGARLEAGAPLPFQETP